MVETPWVRSGPASADAAEPLLRLQLLGRFRVWVSGQPIEDGAWRRRRAAALVKLLALAPGHRLHREQVMEQLWPGSPPAAAVNNLHFTVHAARGVLQPGAGGAGRLLRFDGEQLVLAPSGLVTTDVAELEAAAAAALGGDAPRLRAALTRYTGDLLPEDSLEEWTLARRDALRRLRVALLAELAALCERAGDAVGALDAFEQLVEVDPCDEAARRGLMRLHAGAGRVDAAVRHYRALREALRRELDAEPAAETEQLYRAIAAAPTVPAPLPRPRRDNLPLPLTRLIGRAAEVEAVRARLDASRLVTLTGPGGTGKTRLALAVAARLADELADGAWLVELAPLRGGGRVPAAIARALDVREAPGRPLVDLLAALAWQEGGGLALDEAVAEAHLSTARNRIDEIGRRTHAS